MSSIKVQVVTDGATTSNDDPQPHGRKTWHQFRPQGHQPPPDHAFRRVRLFSSQIRFPRARASLNRLPGGGFVADAVDDVESLVCATSELTVDSRPRRTNRRADLHHPRCARSNHQAVRNPEITNRANVAGVRLAS
jgi:hypothetical protein